MLSECRKENCPKKLLDASKKYKDQINSELEAITKKMKLLRDKFVFDNKDVKVAKAKDIADFTEKLKKLKTKYLELKVKKHDNKYTAPIRQCTLPKCQNETRKFLQSIKKHKCNDCNDIKSKVTSILAKPTITANDMIQFQKTVIAHIKRS
jgi:hypothetical protein